MSKHTSTFIGVVPYDVLLAGYEEWRRGEVTKVDLERRYTGDTRSQSKRISRTWAELDWPSVKPSRLRRYRNYAEDTMTAAGIDFVPYEDFR